MVILMLSIKSCYQNSSITFKLHLRYKNLEIPFTLLKNKNIVPVRGIQPHSSDCLFPHPQIVNNKITYLSNQFKHL
ncbi:hypothetical protein N187_D02 (plasmid) [Borrelia anserina Es]|uniref:Uncharacterized protein n=1 Tax=Borrelia anserina Es TaxID=1365188 RepID=A0ABM6FVX0_BORAN|nr:hypothetical protein N187_D02 [Borrelia anserina Es]